MADSTLLAIQKMVRNITQTPQEAQLTTAQLNEYINTFILYDFPQNLRLFGLRTTLTFYTQPNIDTYDTNTTDVNSPLYNFKNKYTAVHEPAFVAGVRVSYTQDRNIFFAINPQTNFLYDTLLRGNGTPGPFVGTLTSVPVLQNNVIFTIVSTSGVAMAAVDRPNTPNDNINGQLYTPNNFAVPIGTINYITGAFSITWPSNTQLNSTLTAETIPYAPGIPTLMLYFDSKFKLWPVPDKLYSVQIEANIVPTELLAAGDHPDFNQWWQYIALGACIKVFRDRMDMDSIQLIMPEYTQQEMLCQRPTLDLATNKRAPTIYDNNRQNNWNWNFGRWPY